MNSHHRFVVQKLLNVRPLAIAALLTAVALPALSHAGTRRDDRLDSLYTAHAAESQFQAVGSYSNNGWYGSFTLIAPDWALTAAHVVDSNLDGILNENVGTATIRIGSQYRTGTEAFVPVGIDGNRGWNGDINAGFDIALVHLSSPFTGITPATIYTGFQELGQQITSVGYGLGGTGTAGSSGSVGTKRAEDNVIDQLYTFSNGATAFRYDFDEPAPRTSVNRMGSTVPLNLEGMIAGGDSGGGTFLQENGQWYVAGVHSGTYNYSDYPGSSSYGDVALITRVTAYQDFIISHVPDLAIIPEPTSLAGVALAGLLLMRRSRRA